MLKNSLLVATAIPMITMATNTVVYADDGASEEIVFDEMLVTATRRQTAAQDTPIALSVVSGDRLEKIGATAVLDIVSSVPGLDLIDEGPGERRLVIRGIQGVGEAQTGLYYDETFVTGAPGTENDSGARQPDFRLIDIERIEVLKGPQGTLYGSSSVGGTVRVITKKPVMDEVEGFVEAGISTTSNGGESYDVNGAVNIPLVEGKVAARAVAYYQDQAGYIDNIGSFNNVSFGPRDDINDFKSWGGRFALRIQPNENLTIDAKAMIHDVDAGARANFLSSLGDYTIQRSTQEFVDDRAEIYNLTIDWQNDNFQVVGSSSYYKRDLVINFDGTPLSFIIPFIPDADLPLVVNQPQNVENWTNEIRINSIGDSPFQWTFGAFFENRDSDLESRIAAGTTEGLIRPNGDRFLRLLSQSLDQRSVFGEISYDLTDQLTITGGLRWYDYELNSAGELIFPFFGFGAPGPSPDGFAEEDGILVKVNASYDINDDAMVYATFSQGVRPGGANAQIFEEVPLQYDSDSVNSYEIGLKSTFLDNRVSFNLAAFRLIWNDIQVAGETDNSFSFTGNAGQAKIDGVELELNAILENGFSVYGTIAYLNPRLSEDQVDPEGFFLNPGQVGDRIPRIARFTTSFGVEYTHEMNSDWNLTFRADSSYRSMRRTEFNDMNPNFREVDDYFLLNTSVEFASEEWSIRLYANNLTDKLGQSNLTVSNDGLDEIYPVRPRTVGLSVKRQF